MLDGHQNFQEFAKRKRIEYGDKFDPSELAPQFFQYFKTGVRIKIKFPNSLNEVTGTVGITTGWVPVFLLLRTSHSISSSHTLSEDDKIIAVKVRNKYVGV